LQQATFLTGMATYCVYIGCLKYVILPKNKTLIGDSCLRMFNTLYKKEYLLQLPMIYGSSGMIVGKFMSHDFSRQAVKLCNVIEIRYLTGFPLLTCSGEGDLRKTHNVPYMSDSVHQQMKITIWRL